MWVFSLEKFDRFYFLRLVFFVRERFFRSKNNHLVSTFLHWQFVINESNSNNFQFFFQFKIDSSLMNDSVGRSSTI